MNHRIRLGPVAIFLAVVAIVLTTLAVLIIATSHADKVMAERFAFVTSVRYDLEKEGNMLLQQAEETVRAGGDPGTLPGVETGESGSYTYAKEQDGYRLEIEFLADSEKHTCNVTGWDIKKIWNGEDPITDIWQGNRG